MFEAVQHGFLFLIPQDRISNRCERHYDFYMGEETDPYDTRSDLSISTQVVLALSDKRPARL